MKWCKVITFVFFLHVKRKKLSNPPWFLVLDKIQDGDLFGDVADFQQRHHP